MNLLKYFREKSVQPSFSNPTTQLVTANQFFEPLFKKWACSEIGWQFGFNRKLWEYSFILNAINHFGKFPGKGLGFGVGREPIVPVMLRYGAELLVSDLKDEDAQRNGWDTMAFEVADLSSIEFAFIDMNDIPEKYREFDFLWSCGSLEHIGGHAEGLEFIKRSLACLKPGGLAVHTTEFNVSHSKKTFMSPGLSLYRESDIVALSRDLAREGHQISCNFNQGEHPLDSIVSDDNSPWELSLKVSLQGFTATSIGIIIQKAL